MPLQSVVEADERGSRRAVRMGEPFDRLDRQAADSLLEESNLEGERAKPGDRSAPTIVALGDPAGDKEQDTVHPGTVRGVRGAAQRGAERPDARRLAPRVATGRPRPAADALRSNRVAWTPVCPTPRLASCSCADVQGRAQRRDQLGMQVLRSDLLTNERIDG